MTWASSVEKSRGFALPIVMLLSVLATSILAYDLHRLQRQAGLSGIALLKKNVQLVFDIESQSYIAALNQYFKEHQCSVDEIKAEAHPCQRFPRRGDRSFLFEGSRYQIKITFVQPSSIFQSLDRSHTSSEEAHPNYAALQLSSSIHRGGQDFTWLRYAYISTAETEEGIVMLERSQLVQLL